MAIFAKLEPIALPLHFQIYKMCYFAPVNRDKIPLKLLLLTIIFIVYKRDSIISYLSFTYKDISMYIVSLSYSMWTFLNTEAQSIVLFCFKLPKNES